MKLVPMRFCSYTWHHNPKSIKVICNKDVVNLCSPYQKHFSNDFGENLKTVSGVGELYGENCLEEYRSLEKVYKLKKQGILSIPKTICMYARFEKLSLIGEAKENVLTYEFVFKETANENTEDDTSIIHTVSQGETLWDIANMYEKKIESLVSLNPQIRYIDDLTDIEKVRVC